MTTKYNVGIQLKIEMPTQTNLNQVIQEIKKYMNGKIKTSISFTWIKKDLDSKLSEIRQYITQKPLNAEIKTYLNEGVINAQIQGLKNKLNEANINIKANIISGTKSNSTSQTDIVNDYVSNIEGSLLKQSEVLKNGNLVKNISDYNLALGETARVVENVSKKGSSFTETLTTNNETVKKTTQSLKLYQEQAKIDVVKFKDRYTGLFDEKQLTIWTDKVQKLTPVTENLSYRMQLLNKEFGMMKAESASRGLDLVNKSSMTLGETLKIAFERFPVWIIASTAIMGLIHQINDAFSFITETNTKLTTLQMEMTQTKLNFSEITTEANKFALAMGNTTKNVLSAISVFGTYKSSLEDTMIRSKAAILLTNLTGESIETSSDAILSMQNQFGYAANQAEHLVDVLAGTARMLSIDYPIAIKEVSAGIERVGSVAEQSGVSLERLSAMIGTTAEVTRMHGEVIGNAYKTIFSRMTAVNEEINPEEYKKVEQVFNDIGIAIKSSADTIRPISDVFDDLHSKWSSLNSVQKNNIAQEAAGIRQKNIFLATMEHYNDVLTNTEQATNSLGVAQSKQDIFMNSLQAHLNQFKASLEGLYNTLSSTGTLKGIVDIATSATTGFTKFASIIGGIPALITASAVAIALFSTKLDGVIGKFLTLNQLTEMQKTNASLMPTFQLGNLYAIIPLLDKIKANKNVIKEAFDVGKKTTFWDIFGPKFEKMVAQVEKMPIAFKGGTMSASQLNAELNKTPIGVIDRLKMGMTSIGNAANTAKGGVFALSTALKSFELGAIRAKIASIALQATMTLGFSIAFSVAFGWIMKVADGFINAKKNQTDFFNEMKNSVSTLTSEVNESNKLISIYESLSNKTNQTIEEKDKLKSTIEKLSSLYPGIIEQFNAEGEAIKINTSLTYDYINAKQKELDQKKESLQDQFKVTGTYDLNTIKNNIKELKEIQDEISIGNKSVQSGFGNYLNSFYDKIPFAEGLGDNIKKYNELKTSSKEAFDRVVAGYQSVYKEDQNFKSMDDSGLLLLIRTVTDEVSKMPGSITTNFENIMNSIGNANSLDIIKNYQDQVTQYQKGSIDQDALWHNQAVAIDELGKAWDGLPQSVIDALLSTFIAMPDPTKKTTDNISNLGASLKTLQETFSTSRPIIQSAQKALQEFDESGKFNIDTIITLAKDHSQLLTMLNDEGAIREELTKIINEEVDKQKEAYAQMLMDEENFYNLGIDAQKSANAQKLMDDENFYNTKISGNVQLIQALNTYYGVDLSNCKSLAEAKLLVDKELIQQLSTMWAEYYNVTSGLLSEEYSNAREAADYFASSSDPAEREKARILGAELKIVEDKVRKLHESENKLKNIALGVSSVDFSAINQSDSSSASSSSNPSTSVSNEAKADLELIQSRVEKIKASMELLSKSSEEYRQSLLEINTELVKEQELLHIYADKQRAIASDANQTEQVRQKAQIEANKYSTEWAKLQKEINSNLSEIDTSKVEKLFDIIEKSNKLYENNIKIIKNQLSLLDDSQVQEKVDKTKELSNAYQNYIDDLTKSISKLKEEQSQLSQTSQAFIDLEDKIQSLQNTLSSTLTESQSDLTSQLQQTADEIVSIYKEMYEKQKDVALNAIDEEVDAEEERHQEYLDNLEEESDAFEESVQRRIDALDDLADKEDYNKNLTDKQKERQEILDEINSLSMDNSLEARARLSELNEELADKDDEINELQKDHERKLIKKNLQAQIDANKKEVEEKEEAEEEKYEATKERLENEKEATENYWDELINDEKHYAEIRRQILEGNFSQIESDFAKFGVFLNNNMEEIGDSISNGLISKLEESVIEAKNLQTELANITTELNKQNAATDNYASIITQMKSNSAAWGTASTEGKKALAQENQELGALLPGAYYDSNSGIWYDPEGNKLYSSDYYDNLSSTSTPSGTSGDLYSQTWATAQANNWAWFYVDDGNGKKYYWTDTGSYIGTSKPSQSKIDNHYGEGAAPPGSGSSGSGSSGSGSSGSGSSGSGSSGSSKIKLYTQYDQVAGGYKIYGDSIYSSLIYSYKDTALDYIKSQIEKYPDKYTMHTGGIVGQNNNSPPSEIVDIVNKLFNIQPGEQVVKSLIGELQIPSKNILNNFIPNMQNLINSLTPQLSINTKGSSGDVNFTQKIIIQNVNANNINDVNNMIEKVYSKMIDGLNISGLSTSY